MKGLWSDDSFKFSEFSCIQITFILLTIIIRDKNHYYNQVGLFFPTFKRKRKVKVTVWEKNVHNVGHRAQLHTSQSVALNLDISCIQNTQ